MRAGSGQTVFSDVPVAPGSYPASNPHEFAVRSKHRVNTQSFNYGIDASPWNVVGWYRSRLPRGGWHVDSIHPRVPHPGALSIIASRRGEALTIVIEGMSNPTQVTIIKVNSTT